MAAPKTQIVTYVGTKNLKEAIDKYSKKTNRTVMEIIIDVWKQMLSSGDLSLAIKTRYEETIEMKETAQENQVNRRFKFNMPPEIIIDVDNAIVDYKKDNVKVVMNRSLFNQEAIRRYLEPKLITLGYLDSTQFKDKNQAVKNLVNFRSNLGLNKREFLMKYLTLNDNPILSYPQYASIERTGKGNVDRILKTLADTMEISEDAFYLSTEHFLNYLNTLSFENCKH